MKVVVKKKVPVTPVVIGTEFIKLESAKLEIQEGRVSVNGEICTMRGKKLYPGDQFTYEGEAFVIAIHGA